MRTTALRRGGKAAQAAPTGNAARPFNNLAVIFGWQVGVGVALIVLWELASGRLIDARLISRPSEVLTTTLTWIGDGTLGAAVAATLYVVAWGLLSGIAIGIASGILVASSRTLDWIFEPMIRVLFALPKVALVPLSILWFGVSYEQRIVLTATVVFFFIFYAAYQGYKEVPSSLRDMLEIQGAGPIRRIWVLYLPASAGWILGGLRIAVPYSFIAAVTPEIIASREGLGHLIQQAASFVQPAGMFAAIITLGFLALAASVLTERVAKAAGPRFLGASEAR